MYNTYMWIYVARQNSVYFSVRMPICLHACVRVFRHVCLPATDCLHLCQVHLGNWLTAIHSVPVITTFLFAGVLRSTTGESISGSCYHSQNENMSGLNSAFSNQNRQRKCSVFVAFSTTHCVYSDVEINTCSFQTGCPRLWDCVYWHSLRGVNRTSWTFGSWRCCLCLNFVSSIPAGPVTICRLLCGL